MISSSSLTDSTNFFDSAAAISPGETRHVRFFGHTLHKYAITSFSLCVKKVHLLLAYFFISYSKCFYTKKPVINWLVCFLKMRLIFFLILNYLKLWLFFVPLLQVRFLLCLHHTDKGCLTNQIFFH